MTSVGRPRAEALGYVYEGRLRGLKWKRRVRGLGSAHAGTHHWLLQRFTAIGNLILGLFLATSLALLPAHDFATMKEWVSQPVPAIALALFAISFIMLGAVGAGISAEMIPRWFGADADVTLPARDPGSGVPF